MPVALVGMGALFPGARDLGAYWRNLRDGVDAVRDVPADRWDTGWFDAAAGSDGLRFYCRRGGFLDPEAASVDAVALGVPPRAADAAEPDQLLALAVARRALDDIVASVRPDPERVAVVLGRGGYVTPAMARCEQRVRTAEHLARLLRELVPELSEDRVAAIRERFREAVGPSAPAEAIGLVPNLVASRIANRLDLRGPAYTVDAACASGLVALDHAVRELASGRCDLVLAGGVHVCHEPTFWSVFTQLGAVSRAGVIRPFDARADGLLLGEGVGVVACKRLEDARRDGDRVYAVVRGTGVSSDGRAATLMSPAVEGQVLALQRAWEASGLDPAEVGLVEAHGTATRAGDAAELRTLARVFGPRAAGAPRATLGSVKSMIGHAMPAAGAAGLIKAALAVHHGVLLPTLHCDEPHPLLAETAFETRASPAPWEGATRVAGVDAFGFGGINAHAVLEAPPRTSDPVLVSLPDEPADDEACVVFAGATPREVAERLARVEAGGRGPCRLAVFDPTPERLALAARVVERGQPWRGRRDVFFTPDGLLGPGGGGLVWLFPGVEAAFDPRVDDVAEHLHLPRPRHLGATDLEVLGGAIVGVGRLLADALGLVGARPDAIAGHSVGEWTAMVASGLIPPHEVDAFIDGMPPATLEVPDVVFVSVGAGVERAEAAIEGLPGVEVTHDNCPHQSILCGPEAEAQVAVSRLREARVVCRVLPFRSGFHSSRFRSFLGPHLHHIARMPLVTPRVPLWSATTCAPFPDDPAAVRALAERHLVDRVRFRGLVEALYEAGHRAFVQVGVGSVTGFVGDTLGGRPHLSIAAGAGARRSGLAQLRRVAVALAVEGLDVHLDALPWRRGGAPGDHQRRPLQLGAPLVTIGERLERAAPAEATPGLVAAASTPLLAELEATLAAVGAAGRSVVARYHEREAPQALREDRVYSVERYPELVDHTFYRQPEGWTDVADRFPVVPMTMMVEHMAEVARRLAPGRRVVAVEDVRAHRWLCVAPPAEVAIEATRRDDGGIAVRLGDYAQAVVRVDDRYPAPRGPGLGTLARPAAPPMTGQALYDDGWLFHGPAYQGLRAMTFMCAEGVDGTLEAGAAPGALLDNAGQLMGAWIMLNTTRDRLSFPRRIARITWHGPEVSPGTLVDCLVRVRSLDERHCVADLEVRVAGRPWVTIVGWEDRRFDTDDVTWPMIRHPAHDLIGEPERDGRVVARRRWRGPASAELMARRYLNQADLAAWGALSPLERNPWLVRRIAIVDAVRHHLLHVTGRRQAIYPLEVTVAADRGEQVVADVLDGEPVLVSVAIDGDSAVACVADEAMGEA